jgi:hypothetical protein
MDTPEPSSVPRTTVFITLSAVAIVVFVLVVIAAILGSYFIAIHTVDVNNANLLHAEIMQHAALCKQILPLDNAKNGIKFSAPTKTGTAELYILHLVKAIHGLVVKQGCG